MVPTLEGLQSPGEEEQVSKELAQKNCQKTELLSLSLIGHLSHTMQASGG